MGAARAVNELHIDAHAAVAAPHAAFEHITHAEIAADLLHVSGTATKDEAGIARNHEQPLDARQARDDVGGHAIGEPGGIAGMLERKDRNRRLFGNPQRW